MTGLFEGNRPDQHCPSCECDLIQRIEHNDKPYVAEGCPNCDAKVYCSRCGTEL